METLNSDPELAGSTARLVFDLDGARYAVSVPRVYEILWLPELTPLPQAPFDVPGIFNLRGKIVTVVDLNLRLGYRARLYRTSNRIIVLSDRDRLVGIIVDHVREVIQLDDSQLSEPPDYGIDSGQARAALYFSHVARLPDQLITLLDEDRLLHYSRDLHDMILEVNAAVQENGGSEKVPARQLPIFCPEATPEERAEFQKRARALLAEAQIDTARADALHVAILALGRELFALELDSVLEFTDMHNPTLVPCTPEHVVGCMNLRGEILPLLDIRGALNLGLAARTRGAKIVVSRLRGARTGIVVDEILDILSVAEEEVRELPESSRDTGRDYLKGTVVYAKRHAALLDLERVIYEGGLVVQAGAEQE